MTRGKINVDAALKNTTATLGYCQGSKWNGNPLPPLSAKFP